MTDTKTEPKEKTNFGATLTGIAALITAVVGMVAYLKPNTPPTAVSSQQTTSTPTPGNQPVVSQPLPPSPTQHPPQSKVSVTVERPALAPSQIPTQSGTSRLLSPSLPQPLEGPSLPRKILSQDATSPPQLSLPRQPLRRLLDRQPHQ